MDMRRMLLPLVAAALLAGCAVRSISNSGYPADRSNALYHGELSEFDVLGIDPAQPISDQDIARAFVDHHKIALHKGAAIMVIQSGALMPDEPMMKAFGRYFVATPFSGVPMRGGGKSASSGGAAPSNGHYARMLRLAAAKGGYEVILCYWGVLESSVEDHATKLVSWLPIVGMVVPDETQAMRIRLRVAVVDVKSGNWSMFAPEPFTDSALSASIIRRQSDQKQVELLKTEAYEKAAEEFVARYTE
jgi:hypothetical protein